MTRRLRRISVGVLPLILGGTTSRGETPSTSASAMAFAQVRDGSSPAALLDLGGAWQFKATDEGSWREARVPGTIHTDLMRIGRIPDPFFRDNELKVQWVERKEWEYRRRFHVGAALLRHARVFLECRGLDTIAEVGLNGALVAVTSNMFVEHEFDVKRLLRPGENEIHVVFRSILEWNRARNASDPRALPLCTSGDARTDCAKGNTFFARKEASDFGWNWGPRLLTVGIWKAIRLAAYDQGRIPDLAVRQDLADPQRALLDVTAQVERFAPGRLSLALEVSLDGKTLAATQAPIEADGLVRRSLAIASPRLWWPRGWGEQPLYTVTALLWNGTRVVHSRSLRIGLRRVELVREKDARGESFGFRVNGHMLFAKGANWIPADAFPDRISEDRYRQLLGAAAEANMNMVRLWGGGLQEADAFYEFCDENGILIWHDFMFAVGPYIANPSYLEDVRREIEGVVRRRRHHPSIALWCGNNEQESNMAGGQRWLRNYPTVTWEDYDTIFHRLIPETTARLDPDRPYWPSSPHHPLDRELSGSAAASGDVHDWSVWHGGQPLSAFEQLSSFRFVSEFGFAAPPTPETVRSFTLPEDRVANSYVMDLHDKEARMTRSSLEEAGHNRSASRIARYLASLFLMPADFDAWVYQSQVLQAEAIRAGAEALRRAHPASTGSLYWQLNDNWPTLSKSSLDYYGRWKALHYFARRFYAPVLASALVRGTTVALWGVNDGLHDLPATLEWRLGRFDGSEVTRGAQPVRLPANSSSRLLALDLAEALAEPAGESTYRNDSFANAASHYLHFRLAQDGRELSSGVVFFAPPKYLRLQDPGLKLTLTPGAKQVEVSAQGFAAFVELGVRRGYARFSDNYFHLRPGESRVLQVLECTVEGGELAERLFARSLWQASRPMR